MRLPVYLLCTVLVVVAKSEETANFYNRRLQPVDMTADQETISYIIPRLAEKYRPNNEWNGVTDPRFYVLTEMESNDLYNQGALGPEGRSKRAGIARGPSLSIVNSLDVLRNRLLLEIARKKAMEGVNRNRDLLSSVGKRATFGQRNVFGYDNNM